MNNIMLAEKEKGLLNNILEVNENIVEEMREVVYSLTKIALIEGKNISPYKLSRIIDHWREELEKVTI